MVALRQPRLLMTRSLLQRLPNEATCDLVTTLPSSGGYTGQLALDTDDNKIYIWDGSAWQSVKGAGSVNAVVGTSSGIVNITITTSGDTVTITPSLDNTTAGAQFLAGPTSAAGAVSYRAIAVVTCLLPLALPRVLYQSTAMGWC